MFLMLRLSVAVQRSNAADIIGTSCLTLFPLISLLILLQQFRILLTAINYITISQPLNKHAPLKSKFIRTTASNHWFNSAIKNFNLLNVILNVSGVVLIPLKIFKTCALPLIITMLPSYKLNEPNTFLSFHLVLLILVNFIKMATTFFIALFCLCSTL